MVPDAVAQFVADAKKGISKEDLIALAISRGLSPTWKPLPHIGPGIYGMGLDADGMGVPLMVRMKGQ